MPKHEKGTPKEIANRCKSKGLQKLRWYCQMCQKQCRDQNGFKCHLTSEAHQRQLMLFAENQNSYLRQFSREFESNFMHILRHTFGTKRIRANEVYQEYIKDKGHVHMNSTVWHTLTGFVMYLGSSGKCKIDENEKGWHIQYIDQEEELRKVKLQQKAKREKDDEERMNELMQRQVDKAKELKGEGQGEGEEEGQAELAEFKRENDEETIKFALAVPKVVKAEIFEESKPDVKPLLAKIKKEAGTSKSSKPTPAAKRSALDELRDEEEAFKEKRNRRDYWLAEGIVVKVMTKKLGPQFYKAKARVVQVLEDKYTAKVELLDTQHGGVLIKVDQSHLETVIPAVGREMLIVNGAYRGERATLLELIEKKFCLKLKIKQGTRAGRIVETDYEDASKVY